NGGYHPFLYNFTINSCKFLEKPKNSLKKYFYDLFASYSNINHSCPYDHDVLVNELPMSFLNSKVTGYLPFTKGDYVLKTSWLAYGINRADVTVYFSIV
ncbi:uncharacterized protein LOC115625399, partial [Scaptodrosophila lebanonensis]|uniref:Uncharacterized protein LOC115625399 n=1 Tax=Drosophila lebanonensis TaxID=7225 RepID=A0A6J2TME4_DROLE